LQTMPCSSARTSSTSTCTATPASCTRTRMKRVTTRKSSQPSSTTPEGHFAASCFRLAWREDRRPLLHERPGGLAEIVRTDQPAVSLCFEFQVLFEPRAFGRHVVGFHRAQRLGRLRREERDKLRRLVPKSFIGPHARHEAHPLPFLGAELFAQERQLPRLRCTDKPRQRPWQPHVARDRDLEKRRTEVR